MGNVFQSSSEQTRNTIIIDNRDIESSAKICQNVIIDDKQDYHGKSETTGLMDKFSEENIDDLEMFDDNVSDIRKTINFMNDTYYVCSHT